jgi:EmrB/QacA subfamily drug resistance transporter
MSITLDPPTSSPTRRRWALGVLCLGALVVVASNMALNVALPAIGRDLGAGVTALAWVVDAYVLCFAGLLLPAGALGDRFGRRLTMQTGLVVFAVAAGLGALSDAVWQLVLTRAVMGLGAALVTPGTLSILTQLFPPAERARAIGIWAAVAGGGVALSLTGAGWMLDHARWPAIFVGLGLLAAVTFVGGALVLPEYRAPVPRRPDIVGAVLSVVGVTALLHAVIAAPDDGPTAPGVLGGVVGGVLALGLFTVVELRRPAPMLDLRLFRARGLTVGCLAVGAVYLALFGTYFVLTQYLQLVRGLTPLQAGVAALPAGLAQFAVATALPPVLARLGARRVLPAGLLVAAAGLGTLALAGATGGLVVLETGLALTGAGVGLTMPPATTSIMAAVPVEQAGLGSALNNLVRELGGAFGIGLFAGAGLLRYRAGLPADAPATARDGLAQALAVPDATATADAARAAFASGVTVATACGAVVLVVAALIVRAALPPSGRSR